MIDLSARPAVRRGAVVLRVLFFVVVLAGGMMGERYRMTESASITRLLEDLREGRVDTVEYSTDFDAKGNVRLDVRWSTGTFSWWEFHGNGGRWPKELREAFPEDAAEQEKVLAFAKALPEVLDGRVSVGLFSYEDRDDRPWPKAVPDSLLAVLVWLVFGGMFAVMLTTSEHRIANRWAWTWLFLSSPLGILAYLCLETGRPSQSGRPFGGVWGFAASIVAGLLFAAASSGFFWLVS